MRDWWTTKTHKSFEDRSKLLAEQYSAFSTADGSHVNGKQTVGENIGDLTGVAVAYEAYQLYLKDHGGSAPVLNTYTGDQHYFYLLHRLTVVFILLKPIASPYLRITMLPQNFA